MLEQRPRSPGGRRGDRPSAAGARVTSRGRRWRRSRCWRGRCAVSPRRSPLNPFYDAAVQEHVAVVAQLLLRRAGAGRRASRSTSRRSTCGCRSRASSWSASRDGLMLPEALFGTAAVPLLFAAVRRIWSPRGPRGGARAGAAADRGDHLAQRHDGRGDDGADRARAAVLARRRRAGRSVWLLLAAAALGLAFDVKLRSRWWRCPGLRPVRATRRCPARAGGAPGSCWPRGACTWRWRSRGCSRRSPSRPTSGPSRTARATAAPGTRRSCSTASTASRASRARPEHRTARPPGTPPPSRYAQLTQSQREDIPLRRPSAGRLLDRRPAVGRAPRPPAAGGAAAGPAGARLRAARAPPASGRAAPGPSEPRPPAGRSAGARRAAARAGSPDCCCGW